MYFKFSSLFIDFKKKGRKVAAFFEFINLSGLHSHTYYANTHLFKQFIEDLCGRQKKTPVKTGVLEFCFE